MIEAQFSARLRNLDSQINSTPPSPAPFRETLRDIGELLAKEFRTGTDVVELVHARARFVDSILQRAWTAHIPADARAPHPMWTC